MTEGHRFSQSAHRDSPRSKHSIASVTLAFIGGANLAPGIASAQPFFGLGHLPGTSQSYVAGLTHDGSIAVGYCEEDFATGSYIRAFRWSRGRGMEDLGTLPGGTAANASAISADGSVIVGGSASPTAGWRATRWVAGNAPQNLGTLPGDVLSSATDVSCDGSVVVGYSGHTPRSHVFRWTNSTGMQDLGAIPGGVDYANAWGVSCDGTVIAGSGQVADGFRAIRWTSDTGIQNLGALPGAIHSNGYAVSGDGLVIVGMNEFPAPPDTPDTYSISAFYWKSPAAGGGGMISLPMPPGWTGSAAVGVSGDGGLIVGAAGNASTSSAAVCWNSSLEMVDLSSYLPSIGADLTGWTLDGAGCISADGRTIAGYGMHNGVEEAWIATIPRCGSADFNHDGAVGTDADIAAFFACLAGNCCSACDSANFNGDADVGTDADIEAFFRVLAGGSC